MALKCESNVKRKAALAVTFCAKKERNATLKKVYALLKKTEVDRSEEEKQFLLNCIDLVKEVRLRIEKQKKLKERLQEVEDPPDVVAAKCRVLAEALTKCRRLVVYTGAGVSTAACIPDYRGSNGIWTLLQQGKDIGLHDLSKAEPTLTHMALTQLYQVGLVKHIVSQNCDGLHLRSGLPKEALSEVHGNMYIEVCRQCQPIKEYLRLFDVTENTARFSHRTGRRCYVCSGSLVDSIVHFGERGTLKWPLNWPGAVAAAANADAILCIGSSLKVLKKYPWLWGMDKNPKKRPKLYIVNLQWTPKDDHAVLKINAKCDFVMKQLMSHFQIEIPLYSRLRDPVFPHATPLHSAEIHTTTKPLLITPENIWAARNRLDTREFLSVKYEKLSLVNINDSESNEIETKPDAKSCSSKSENCVFDSPQNVKDENGMKNPCQANSIKCEKSRSSWILPTYENLNGEMNIEPSAHHEMKLSTKTKLANDKSYCFASSLNESLVKNKSDLETFISIEPSFEIIYEGVKLKVEDNISVQANVKINNDMAILCDSTSIHQNSFIFNSSYELEESDNNIKFVHLNESKILNYLENEPYLNLCDTYDKQVSSLNKVCASEINPSLDTENSKLHNEKYTQSGCEQEIQDFSIAYRTSFKLEKSHECLCCFTWYGTAKCLFYTPRKAVFRDTSRGICDCCTEESDEAEEPSETDKNESKEGSTGLVVVKSISNPGWYGKGYRKRMKKKR